MIAPESIVLKLDPHRVDLWFAFYDEINEGHLLDRYRLLLSNEEREREQRIYLAKNRHRFLVTRALVRTVLSRYAPVPPKHWSFLSNSYGKPGISNDGSVASRISFNVSHTDGLIVLGVTCETALGVDIENVHSRRATLDSTEAYLSDEESLAITELSPDQRSERFFQYWTLKESYIKARGMGLSIPLGACSFRFTAQNRICLATEPSLKDTPSRWQFWQLRPSPDHLTAVCAERYGNGYKHLTSTRIIPLGAERPLDCVPVLESE